ncbi:MAG: MCE family protein [Acidimicrobiales bacterium]
MPFWARSARVVIPLVLAVMALGLAGCAGDPSSGYTIHADFTSAEGLFPGNAVDLLGVQIGTVSTVQNSSHGVAVAMHVSGHTILPEAVVASLVSPQLLGEPSVELSPGYTGGPKFAPGAAIPQSRTSVPLSTNRMLTDLASYLRQIDPKATGNLINNLAQDLSGQGSQLNVLIHNAAGTISLLAGKGNTLGKLEGSLAQISSTLRAHDTTIARLIGEYDAVSGVVASSQQQLGAAVSALDAMSTQLANLLTPNLGPLQTDVGTLTTAGRTLYRNLSSVDQTLSSSVALFSGAKRAYSPTYRWLNVDLALSSTMTSGILAGMIRDRLAGVCRRILANHSAGLGAAQLGTLRSCGNPASGFFNSVIDLLPTLFSHMPGSVAAGPTSSSAETQAAKSAFSKGLSRIPGISQSQKKTLTSSGSLPGLSGTSGTASQRSGALGRLPRLFNASQAQPSGNGGSPLSSILHGIGGLLHSLGGLW